LTLTSIEENPLKQPIKLKYKHSRFHSNFEDKSFKSKLKQLTTLDMVNSLPRNSDGHKLPSNFIILCILIDNGHKMKFFVHKKSVSKCSPLKKI
jgi:hypothetical protein